MAAHGSTWQRMAQLKPSRLYSLLLGSVVAAVSASEGATPMTLGSASDMVGAVVAGGFQRNEANKPRQKIAT